MVFQNQHISTLICDILIAVKGKIQRTSIGDILQKEKYHWCSTVDMFETVVIYDAVVARDDTLVNVEDYVSFSDAEYNKVMNNGEFAYKWD